MTPLGKTRQACWQGVQNNGAEPLIERLDCLPLGAGEPEGVDLLLLQAGDELVRFPGRGERARDEPLALTPYGDMRRLAVEQPAGLALDPAPIELERFDVASGCDLHPVPARMDGLRRFRLRRLD